MRNQDKFVNLVWSSFYTNVPKTFEDVRASQEFSDITLACDDEGLVEAHKMILASGSTFFQKLLSAGRFRSNPSPIIFLKGVKVWQLEAVMDFLYSGETRVRQGELNSFLELAQQLGIVGLMAGIADWLNESGSDKQSETHMISNILHQPVNEDLNIPRFEKVHVSESADNIENQTPEEKELKVEDSGTYLEDTTYKILKPNGQKIAPICQQLNQINSDEFIIDDLENRNTKSVNEIISPSKPKTMRKKYYYEKKYDCAQCESKFTHKKGFLVHRQSKHEGMKYDCDQCNKQFVQKGHLARHRKIRHKGF